MLPTFLGLGSGRCASTWLHHTLDLHPQITMTCHKEVNFWGKYCLNQSLADYETYFRVTPGKVAHPPVRGDISPRYGHLSRQSIRAVYRHLPEARLILVMRNPVHRAWSHLLMEMAFLKKRNLAETSITTFLSNLERLRHIHDGDYARIIDDWTAVFPTSALHYDLYDRICREPGPFLRDVLVHVGADPNWKVPEKQLDVHIWSTQEATRGQDRGALVMPPIVKWYLSLLWRDRVRELNRRLGGRVDHWVKEIDAAASDEAPLSWQLRRLANRSVMMWPERIAFGAFNTARECALAWRYRQMAAAKDTPDEINANQVAAAPVSVNS